MYLISPYVPPKHPHLHLRGYLQVGATFYLYCTTTSAHWSLSLRAKHGIFYFVAMHMWSFLAECFPVCLLIIVISMTTTLIVYFCTRLWSNPQNYGTDSPRGSFRQDPPQYLESDWIWLLETSVFSGLSVSLCNLILSTFRLLTLFACIW